MENVTITEKTNAVKDSTIAIRPFFNPDIENMGLEKYNMTLYEGAFHSESIICLERNGILRYVTGLNEFAPEIKTLPADEKAAKIKEIRKHVVELEKELAANVISEDDPEFWSKVQVVRPDNKAFWNKITIKVGNDPVFIDPKVDPYDRIKLLAIEAGGFSLVAPNLETAKKIGKYKFYLDKVKETAGTRTKDAKIRNKALGILSDLYDEDKNKLMHLIKLFTYNSAQFTESTPLDVLYEEADSYINGDGRESDVNIAAKNFIDASRMDMEDLRINSMVKDALAINILTTRSDGYIHHKKTSSKIATTRPGVVEFLKNPVNDEMLMDIKKQVELVLAT
tara:strand:- start:16853 stop:17866 length:1014 start_codon:yes stop_codon:yes gene_type:complete